MQATTRAIKTAATTRMTGRSVSGPGAVDWLVDNACVGGAVLNAVEAGTVAVAGERVTVPLETLADIANDE